MKNMKKKVKNGFTLIELLAVIVVLAVIMIIAIPSIMDTMTNAKKETFIMYIEKVYTAALNKYTYDSSFGSSQAAGTYCYNIKKDLTLASTGEYEGYILVTTNINGNVGNTYQLYLHDNTYMYTNSNFTKVPERNDETVINYDADTWTSVKNSLPSICNKDS